ncbi:MAG: type VII toxin-antitoxin system HepT family RNase toxin [Actinomycetota bacterium]
MPKPDNLETEIIIKERLAKIEEAASELKEIRKLPKQDFFKKKRIQYAAMYAMIIGIEAVCDIGNHILAKYFNTSAGTYKDIILLLGKQRVIPQDFSQQSSQMTDFRNILIHLYLKIDTEEVYKNLKKAPQEFTRFSQYFLDFLKKQQP